MTLSTHLADARQTVANLTGALTAAGDEAHVAYVAGDAPAGHDAMERAASLRGQLAEARARLAALEQAAHAIAVERTRDEHEAQLAEVTAAMQHAGDESARLLAEVRPALEAARLALRHALLQEQRANELDGERRSLEVALGRREHSRFTKTHNRVEVAVDEEPMFRAVLQHPGF